MTAPAPLPSATPVPGPSPSPAAKRPSLFVLIAISTIGPVAMNIFLPSMPGLQAALNTSYTAAQLTLTLYLLAFAVGILVISPIADRFGRRMVVLAGTAVFVAASLGCMLSQSIEQLLFWRMVQAAGGGAGVALARAMVRDMHGRSRSASLIGYVTMAWVTMQLVAPAIGGFVDEVAGWRGVFAVLTLLGASVLAIAWLGLHETLAERKQSFGVASMARDFAALLSRLHFTGYALSAACTSGVFFAFAAGAPYIAMDLMGLSPAQYGLWVIMSTGGYLLGNFLSGRLAERAGAHGLIHAGNAVLVVGLALLVLTMAQGWREPLALFGPQAVIGLANGMIVPSAMAGALSVDVRIAGAAAGLGGFMQMGLGVVTTALVGLLHDGTSFSMVVVMVVSGLLSIAAFAVALLARQRE